MTRFPPAYLIYSVASYSAHLANNLPPLEDAPRQAVHNSLVYHLKNKPIYDKKVLPGDALLYKTPWHPNRGRLVPVIEGPYTILKNVFPVNYEIDRSTLPLGKQSDIVRISKLRPYHSPIRFTL